MKMINFRFLMMLPLVLCLAASPLLAQLDRGTITGKVVDPSDAVVPGADVTALNLDTGVSTQTVTNDVGLYTLANIPIGRYEIKFALAGFKTFTRTGITVTVAQTVRLDVKLETGQISEVVTVMADATLLKTDTPLVSTTIQSKIATDLPLSFAGGRAIENFAYAITPGVEGNNWTSFIAGGQAFSKEVLIDGTSATAQIQGHVGESSPTMEAVQEFSVQTSGMSAEYGRTSGGVFNFALKSGTNDFHGSAFYYGRNEALNANTWMNNWGQSQCADQACRDNYDRPTDRQHLYGFSAGGPVIIPKLYNGRNKTFVFGAFEQYEQQNLQLDQSYNQTVPIPEFLDGNFSQLLTGTVVGQDALGRDVYAGQIFDPLTMRQVEGNKWVSDPFDGNIIPRERMSALSSKVIDIYRKNYLPEIPGRLVNNSALVLHNDPWFHQTQLTLKADEVVSDYMKFTGSLIWTQRPRILVDQGGVWDPSDPNNTGGPFARSRKQEVTSRAIRVANYWTLRPNLINTASFVYNRYRNPSLSTQADGGWNQYLGLQDSTSAGLFPEMSFGDAVNGISETEIGYSSSGFYVGNTYIAGDYLQWVKGRHAMKFGGEFWKQQINSHGGLDTLRFDFSNTTTGIPGESWSNQIGFGFASFFLGAVDSANKNVTFDLYGRRDYWDVFFQDDFKATSRLTLNLGLRWEQALPYHEKYGRWANFSPSVMNTAYNVPGALEFLASPEDSFETEKTWKQLSPRVGAAYRLTDKATIRGSYGIFFIPIGTQYWSGVPYGFAPGYRGTNDIYSSGNLPKFNWDQGYPDNFKPATKDPNTLIWGMVANDPQGTFLGYMHQYNLSFQYELSRDLIVEATYMGNQGRRLHDGGLQRNQPTRQAYENPNLNPWAWIWDAQSAADAGAPYPYPGFSGYAGFAVQPFPQVESVTWGPIYYPGTHKGSSGYNSLQLSLTQRLGRGLAAQVSYNFSKAVGDTSSAFDESWDATSGIQDMNDLSKDAKTVLSFDQAHVFKGYLSYQMPFGQGRKYLSGASGLVNAFIGGWDLTWVFRYNTGQPLYVWTSSWYPGWDGAVYADFNPAVDLSRKFNGKGFNPGQENAAGNLYFDPAAFSNPTGHNLGNGKSYYEELRGFGWSQEDLGLMKYWHFTETASLQFRFEFINLFNRHHFADPQRGLGNTTNFGYVTGLTGDPRNIQFGLRFGW